MGDAMTWWRRQRVAVLALVLAASAAVGVHLWLDALPMANRASKDITTVESSASIAGQTLTVGAVRWDEFDAPSGSRTLSVRVEAAGTTDAASCGVFTLTEEASGRLWENARTDLDVPYDAGERSCLEDSGPYEILAVFLLPDDAEGPFLFDVPDTDGVIARFVVAP